MSVCDIGSLPPEKLDWTDFGAGFVAGVTLSVVVFAILKWIGVA